MYQEIIEKYKALMPDFPSRRRPLVGSIIKEIRVDRGLRQMDFARTLGLNESTLKSIENDHQKATTVENLENIAAALGTRMDDLILLGRERDPADYFALKKTAPPEIKGILQRKRAHAEWHKSVRLKFRNFDITPISAPIQMKKDFCMLRLNLPPQRKIENLVLSEPHTVLGFISAGFNIKIKAGNEETVLTGNQGFRCSGAELHSITNEDEDHAAVIYLITQVRPVHTAAKRKSAAKPRFSIEKGIEALRQHLSERPQQQISVKHLADLTDTLDHEQIAKMMRLKKGSSVVYWEKIEDLLSASGVGMRSFLKACRGETDGSLQVSTASTRALIDFSTYHGVKIYSATPPQAGTDLFCGELLMEGQRKLGAKAWQRRDEVMMGLFVEEGEIEVTVGQRRGVLPLAKGESIYFNAGLGYLLRNPGSKQAKAFIASCPALVF